MEKPADDKGSMNALLEATRARAEKSRHGGLGASGYISFEDSGHGSGAFLSKPGETAIINPPAGGLPHFEIGVAWDNVHAPAVGGGLIKNLLGKKSAKKGVDLDLGCLYVLKNGTRGGMQAFGEIHGSLEKEPYIALSGDERPGNREGYDETILSTGHIGTPSRKS